METCQMRKYPKTLVKKREWGGGSSHERHLSSVHSYVHRLRSVNLRVKQTVKLTEGAMHHFTCILVSGRSHGSQNQTGGCCFFIAWFTKVKETAKICTLAWLYSMLCLHQYSLITYGSILFR